MDLLLLFRTHLDSLNDAEFRGFVQSQTRQFLTTTIFQRFKHELNACESEQEWLLGSHSSLHQMNQELKHIIRSRDRPDRECLKNGQNSANDEDNTHNLSTLPLVSISNIGSFLEIYDLINFELVDKSCFFGARAMKSVQEMTDGQFSKLLKFTNKTRSVLPWARYRNIKQLYIDIDAILSPDYYELRDTDYLIKNSCKMFIELDKIWQLFNASKLEKLSVVQNDTWYDLDGGGDGPDFSERIINQLTSVTYPNLTEFRYELGGGCCRLYIFPDASFFRNTPKLKSLYIDERTDDDDTGPQPCFWLDHLNDVIENDKKPRSSWLCDLEELHVAFNVDVALFIEDEQFQLNWPLLANLRRIHLNLCSVGNNQDYAYVVSRILPNVLNGASIEHVALECHNTQQMQIACARLTHSLSSLKRTRKETLEIVLIFNNEASYNETGQIYIQPLLRSLRRTAEQFALTLQFKKAVMTRSWVETIDKSKSYETEYSHGDDGQTLRITNKRFGIQQTQNA